MIGFAVGESQASYVVVDSSLRRKYQAEPGRQEWITVIECICADGSVIPPMVIFKGKRLMSSWLPVTPPKGWLWSCNDKGWTSNEHGRKWLELFNASTATKTNNRKRLLICDGHDSHISAEFVRYCIDNDIFILLLVPHSSHLMQPLDVGVFGPLKRAMSAQLDRVFRTGISRLQKVEWVENYMEARKIAINTSNILGGWRGSGLFPLNKHRILHQLIDSHSTPSTPMKPTTSAQFLNSSSTPDALVLRSANDAFAAALSQTSAPSPVKTHGQCLAQLTARLTAENAILKKDNMELRAQIRKRTERAKGKRLILKDQHAISSEQMYQALSECQKSTRKQTKNVKPRRSKRVRNCPSSDEEDAVETGSELEEDGIEIRDCIVVRVR